MYTARNTILFLGNDSSKVRQIFNSSRIEDLNFEATLSISTAKHAIEKTGRVELLIVDLSFLSLLTYRAISELQQLRSNVSTMALIGHFSSHAVELAVQFGFDEFISTPLSSSVLMALVDKSVRKAQNNHQMYLVNENNF